MPSSHIEHISLDSAIVNDRNLQALTEKAFSPYKSTLKHNSKEAIKALISQQLGAISSELAELFILYPQIFELIKNNSKLLEFTNDNPKLLYFVLLNTSLIELIKVQPQLLKLLLSKPELIEMLKTDSRLLSFVTKDEKTLKSFLERPQEYLAEANTVNQPDSYMRSKQKKVDFAKDYYTPRRVQAKTEKINLMPHKLEPEIVAKAHIENPNTGIGVGAFRVVSGKNPFSSFKTVPFVKEQLPYTASKIPLQNPQLLSILGAIAATINKSKVQNQSGKDFEVETPSEFESTRMEEIKSVSEVSESQGTSKLSANLK